MTDWNLEVDRIRDLRSARTKVGPGTTPAVVVVDFQRAFTEHEFVGPTTAVALERTNVLLDAARRAGVPVVYLVMVLDSLDDRMLAQRVRSSLTERCERGNPWTEISSAVPAQPGDHIVEKTVASGFYNTRLHDLLQELGVDEIVLAGTSTSGCVRATATDAAYRDYRLSLVEECCDDFRTLSGEVSLWDIQDRFGDVVPLDATLARFTSIAAERSPVRTAS
ncbi:MULTISPECIES: isochorismatase family protein [unclassified Rathayibacter]|uniref:cysteine hydrolase family protein n=1 Tax=unclassified Rathayibacter TaxID=2609250 RepID=UPI0010444F07|nr:MULTISPECIES: isochorismatase family protein [unclassified Rathayibacter]TCL79457.1 maleamate amidohydrolase [Rathayibacter sp. PhB192]TCM25274.1 maleamate amidohydrolase [Rathayibacter sp. PhB179]